MPRSKPILKTFTMTGRISYPVVMSTLAADEREAERLFRTFQAQVVEKGPEEITVQEVECDE